MNFQRNVECHVFINILLESEANFLGGRMSKGIRFLIEHAVQKRAVNNHFNVVRGLLSARFNKIWYYETKRVKITSGYSSAICKLVRLRLFSCRQDNLEFTIVLNFKNCVLCETPSINGLVANCDSQNILAQNEISIGMLYFLCWRGSATALWEVSSMMSGVLPAVDGRPIEDVVENNFLFWSGFSEKSAGLDGFPSIDRVALDNVL